MRAPRMAPNTFVAPAGNWFKYVAHLGPPAMSAFLPLLGDKRASNAPSPGVPIYDYTRRAAEQRYELAALHRCNHSITSSAMATSDGGTVMPNMRAVVLLMTSSNLVDCSTGNS